MAGGMTHIDLITILKVEEEWLIYKDNSDCFKEDEAVIERPQPDPAEVLLNEQDRVLTRARCCGQGDRSLVLELSHSQRDRTGCGPRVFTDTRTDGLASR